MAADVQTLGPGHWFVRFRGDGSASYLGTAEVAAKIQIEPNRLKLLNDVTGRTNPFQLIDDGEMHNVAIAFSRYDYAVWNRVKDRFNHAAALTAHGTDSRLVGGSAVLGIADFQLILVHEFTGIAPAHPLAKAEQPPGRMYYAAVLGPAAEDPSQTRAQVMAALFECYPIYDPTTRSKLLYTEVASSFGALGAIT